MARRFENLVVWITGGGTGIGKALAVELARQGAMVALSGRRLDRLTEAVEAVRAVGGRAEAIGCDVADEESVRLAVAEVVARFGRLDVAVANAGCSVGGRIEALTADEWRRQLDINVVGLALTVRHALAELHKTAGRVVLVGSVSGFVPGPGFGAYTASKYAVRAIGQTLDMELAGSGVSCTTIYPGFVESEIYTVDNQGTVNLSRRDRRPQRLMWTAERSAVVMARAIYRRRRHFVFTGHGKIGVFVGQHWPGVLHLVVTRLAGGKGRKARLDLLS